MSMEDKPKLVARVTHSFKSALLQLHYYPEIWYDFAMYLQSADKTDEAIAQLKTAIEAMPDRLNTSNAQFTTFVYSCGNLGSQKVRL